LQAAIEVPANFTGKVQAPWLLCDVQGDGEIYIGGANYSVGSETLTSMLRNGASDGNVVNVLSTNSGIRFVYMINAIKFSLNPNNEVDLTGFAIDELSVTALTLDSDDDTDNPVITPYLKPVVHGIPHL
jgi:hypothetical protein